MSGPGGDSKKLEESAFTPATLDRTVIALPLLDAMEKAASRAQQTDEKPLPGSMNTDRKLPTEPFEVIIDINLEFASGRDGAQKRIREIISEILAEEPASAKQFDRPESLHLKKSEVSKQYMFARLSSHSIRELARRDYHSGADRSSRAVYKIWLDHEVKRFTNRSISTVKADAAHNAFAALGEGVVWAVLDTGVDGNHPHFQKHGTLTLKPPLRHRDFTGEETGLDDDADVREAAAVVDVNGHGTHVAGIIAGQFAPVGGGEVIAHARRRDEDAEVVLEEVHGIERISGMAPRCKILSLKVLDDEGAGLTSNIIAALEYVQDRNSNGRRILIHGVNLSVGYDFEPKWFACGQSPLCVEVNRLVRSGVVVVVAAGNTGYGYNQPQAAGPVAAGLDVTINDPGNAELAITVGSTHRDMPHVYGVSYFSSKGPTGDGRLKPDLLAPGEKIISCKSRQIAGQQVVPEGSAAYHEDSGTSMAAPHVSGAIAAFLSIRREFIGEPERVKQIFLESATDLGRAVYFQGRGLVDLMRAIQSI
jgi:hypothetical protein